jgi:Tfp pilus assembly protein PilE
MIRRLLRRLTDERGVTLIELMIASGLFMLLTGAVLAALDSGVRTERISQARQEALADMRNAMTRMTKELRQAVSVNPASTATALDMQTLIGGDQHRVIYEVAGASPHAVLQRSVDSAAPIVLATRIVAPTAFCYQYDDTATPPCLRSTPDPATLSSVRISLTLDPVIFSAGSVTLATDIELRNLNPS